MDKRDRKIKLLLATKNRDKIKEIRKILSDERFEIFSEEEVSFPDVVEDGKTIEANAVKKARETAEYTGCITLADDTGLFVRSLQGQPGVKAARFAGENCTYRDNRLKLLRIMTGRQDRYAEFRTVVALALPSGEIETAEGIVEGEITEIELGTKGFGYDSVFKALETGKTFAEMDLEEKQMISHRGRAFRKMMPVLEKLYNRSVYG